MYFADRNLVFIHIPKTGGNYVTRRLIGLSSDRLVTSGHQDGLHRFQARGDMTRTKHQTLDQYADLLGAQMATARVLAIYRAPVERLVSLYFSPHRWMKRRSDGSYSTPPAERIRFDFRAFRHLVAKTPSTWQILDGAHLVTPPQLGRSGRHVSGAEVTLIDFRDLPAAIDALCAAEGWSAAGLGEPIINPSTLPRARLAEVCAARKVRDLVLSSHHAMDHRLVGG